MPSRAEYTALAVSRSETGCSTVLIPCVEVESMRVKLAAGWGGRFSIPDRLTAAGVGHAGGHHRHEQHVRVERQAGHVDHGARDVLDIHRRLGLLDLAQQLRARVADVDLP